MGCKKLQTNFLRVVHCQKGSSAKKNVSDYFSFGMPMPNRQLINGEPYRYAYQGQELDPETGKVAFQLRLYDPRINRWITPDPYGQYPSPYLAMGNNPISRVDPDGGTDCTKPPCNNETEVALPEFSITTYVDDVVETLAGWGDVFGRTWDWFTGKEELYSREVNNNFANAFKDAKGLEKARGYFYEQLNNGRNLFENPVTDFGVDFGLEGLANAGLDPYEQFVGSYVVTEIILIKTADGTYEIQYTLHNKTHFKSAAYHIPGTPSWERGQYPFPDAMGSVRQDIIFTEPLQNNRLNKGVLRYINHNLNGLIR